MKNVISGVSPRLLLAHGLEIKCEGATRARLLQFIIPNCWRAGDHQSWGLEDGPAGNLKKEFK